MHHQRLRCLEVLLRVARCVPSLVRRMPRGYAFLADELKRAVTSAILNCAEGYARWSKKERARFFDISIASTAEAAAAIETMVAYQAIGREDATQISEDLRIAYAMTINLKRSTAHM
jgi:four helix bundle protein